MLFSCFRHCVCLSVLCLCMSYVSVCETLKYPDSGFHWLGCSEKTCLSQTLRAPVLILGKDDIKWKQSKGLSGVLWSINNLRSENWMERKKFFSGASKLTPRNTVKWNEDKNTTPLWMNHDKGMRNLLNQTVALILILPAWASELESGFSHCSQFLPNSGTLLTPSSPRVWQIPSSLAHSLWNNVFLFHTRVSVGPQLSCLFTGVSVLDYLDLINFFPLKPSFPEIIFYYFVIINCLFLCAMYQ